MYWKECLLLVRIIVHEKWTKIMCLKLWRACLESHTISQREPHKLNCSVYKVSLAVPKITSLSQDNSVPNCPRNLLIECALWKTYIFKGTYISAFSYDNLRDNLWEYSRTTNTKRSIFPFVIIIILQSSHPHPLVLFCICELMLSEGLQYCSGG